MRGAPSLHHHDNRSMDKILIPGLTFLRRRTTPGLILESVNVWFSLSELTEAKDPQEPASDASRRSLF